MTSAWQPYREPLWATLARTGAIALVLGAVLTRVQHGGLARWPAATVLMLWPAFGGHWVEIFSLNWLRPRLPASRGVQTAMRIAVWFVGGTILAMAMGATSIALGNHEPPWSHLIAFGGLAFIAIELIAHLVLQLRGRPSFYNGRG